MEKVAIILLVLFLFVVILGPLTCFRLSRPPVQKIYNPQPCQLDDARRKLSTYTTCSTVAQRTGQQNSNGNADTEAVASASEFGECPICIGPLVPEPVHTTGSDPLPVMQQVASVTSKAVVAAPAPVEVGVAGGEAPAPAPIPAPTSAAGPAQAQAQSTATPDAEDDDDILTLNSCGHSFHCKCLSSWFLIERHDCPVCREPYYTPQQQRVQRDRTFTVPPFF